jgi:hypothetical protein
MITYAADAFPSELRLRRKGIGTLRQYHPTELGYDVDNLPCANGTAVLTFEYERLFAAYGKTEQVQSI